MLAPFRPTIRSIPRTKYFITTRTFAFAMAEPSTKRLKPDVTIGTHNGHFHADEALAVYMLRLLPTYRDARLVRTRNQAELDELHTVVDVGGQYDAQQNRYDHHQKTFATTFPNRPTKLSSAGLIYLHFGKSILAQSLATIKDEPVTEEDSDVSLLHPKIYESFIEALDAHDNGISTYDPQILAAAGAEKRFSTGGFNLGAMVGRFNPAWNDPPAGQEAEDAKFEMASQRIGEEFSRMVEYYCKSWMPAREVVAKAYHCRSEADPEGRVMVLKGTSAPWKAHLYTLEEETGEVGKVLYVLYPEKPVEGAKWRVQCVPDAADSFSSRKPLPEAWRGIRAAELDAVSGITGCVFVHAGGFIGGNATYEGAIEMVKRALD
ncbi:putative UPF0160 protein C27H6.8 [Zalerion maritima]|uniref:UPF0160 protein C27H6.8 n=1 Tax=Zalerion maritima TaxID=339359 RepID=A0AAD5WT55_9PEZI|nr:putative UPF0160 protein C27H6.8 [Zalerion maritima]